MRVTRAACALWLGGIGACATGADTPSGGTAVDARVNTGGVDARAIDAAPSTVDAQVVVDAQTPVDARPPVDAAIDAAGTDGGPTGPTIGFTGTATSTAGGGGNGGGPSEVDCAAGQIPTGVEIAVGQAYYAGTIANLRVICSVARISGGALTTTTGAMLPASGHYGSWSYTASPVTSSCPANQVLVGFAGRTGNVPAVNELALRCAPVTIAGTTVTPGAATTLTAVGSGTGVAFGPNDCGAGQIARGVSLQVGEILDRFALRCGTPSVAQ